MSIHIYIAASAAPEQKARVAGVAAALKAIGCRIVCTWPEVVAATPGGSNPRDANWFDRRKWSSTDLAEIDVADLVLVLVPPLPLTTRGAWFEAGYALAREKILFFSGDTLQSVFCALGSEFASDDEALARIVALAVESAR